MQLDPQERKAGIRAVQQQLDQVRYALGKENNPAFVREEQQLKNRLWELLKEDREDGAK